MKLGPETKLDKKSKKTLKNFYDGVMSENCDFIALFQYLTNLKQPGRRIPDA